MRRGACILLGTLLAVVGGRIAPSRGEVRLIEDEAIFTVYAPDAKRVFLVGNFNNWNPTVEPMTREGDRFTASLFLAADEYYYKFVVDGTWISDPDNPPADPEKGSALVLVERGGMLAIKEQSIATGTGDAALLPAVRYIGRATSEDGDEDAAQELDFLFRIGNDIAKSTAVLKTRDDTWTFSSPGIDIELDRCRFELKAAGGNIGGFENDSTWTSADPFGLFGNVGIHDYSFGFGRRGISMEQRVLNLELSAVYADRLGAGQQGISAISEDRVAEFLASPSARSIVYENAPALDGEDAFGWSARLAVGFAEFGFGGRENRGMNAGLLAQMERADSAALVDAFNTREDWQATVLWLRSKVYGPVHAYAGFGGGNARVRRLSRSFSRLERPQEIVLGNDTDPDGARTSFQKSKRWKGCVLFDTDRLDLSLDFERSTFEYSAPIFEPSRADIRVTTLDLRYGNSGWLAEARVQNIDQDYAATPRDFHFFTGTRNFWLDYGDQLSVENMVGFDLRSFLSWSVSISRGKEHGTYPALSQAPDAQSLGFQTGGVVDGRAGTMRYVFARAAYERFIKKLVYVQADARVAAYPHADWNDRQTFGSVYVESGYRSGHMELSLGFGFDPVVFDRTSNEYRDIGRIEFLRGASQRSLLRNSYGGGADSGESQAAAAHATDLEYRLLELEESLQENTSLKLEWIVVF